MILNSFDNLKSAIKTDLHNVIYSFMINLIGIEKGKIMTHEKFVVGVGYELFLNQHSRTALAFRYGIACAQDCVEGYFEGYIKRREGDESDNRFRCKFTINGVTKITLVIEGLEIITALYPSLSSLNNKDAQLQLNSIETVNIVDSSIFPLEEIVNWREKILESNGAINKDDLRRLIKKKTKENKIFSAIKQLGLTEEFFDEVKKLREMNIQNCRQRLLEHCDDKSPEELEKMTLDLTRISALAKIRQTELFEETEQYDEMILEGILTEQQQDAEVKYMEEMFGHSNNLLPPVNGIPFDSGEEIIFSGRKYIYFKDCIVTKIIFNDGGWHQIDYKNDRRNFWLNTKFDNIINSYSVGDIGIYTTSREVGPYLAKRFNT